MKFSSLAKRAGKIASDNSPAILTALGVTGSVMTAILVGKASFKAAEIIAEEQEEIDRAGDGHLMDDKEKIKLVLPLFVPAGITAAITVVCIIGANRIGTRRTAALASAYSVSEKMIHEYKGKVLEKFGPEKEQEIRDEIAKDRLKKDSEKSAQVIVVSGDHLFCELRTGRYFNCNMQRVEKAVNEINWQILNDSYASLSDFYDKIGLDGTDESDEIGWSSDGAMMTLDYSSLITDDGRPCITFTYDATPVRNYYRLHR